MDNKYFESCVKGNRFLREGLATRNGVIWH